MGCFLTWKGDKDKGDNPNKGRGIQGGKARNRSADNKGVEKNWTWNKIPPTEGEPETKTVKGRLYYWCVRQKAWTLHTPDECKLPLEGNSSEAKTATSPSYKEALQTIMTSIGEDEEEWVDSSVADDYFTRYAFLFAVPWVFRLNF